MTTMTTQGTKHPFTKLKKGMAVLIDGCGQEAACTLLDKHNGTQTLTVLHADGEKEVGVPYARYLGTPEADPLDQIHPMLAKDIAKRKTLSVEEVLADPAWGLEEKYDGERQILTFFPATMDEFYATHPEADMREFAGTEETRFRATTRVVGKNTGRLSVNSEAVAHLAHLPVPRNGVTVLDVELMHGEGFQTLRSIMGSLPERAIALQAEKGPVFAIIFDLLWFDGEDLRHLPFRERRDVLTEWFVEDVEETGCPVLLSPLAWEEADKRLLLQHVLQNGGEGAMVKHADAPYTDTTKAGSRSSDVLKIKPFSEDDVVIYGFEMGKGEYNQHKFGAIKFAQLVRAQDITEEMKPNYLNLDAIPGGRERITCPFPYVPIHMGTCSGITDAQEAEFRADPESFIGRVMEVRFQQRWPETGLMRHPNFVRLRDDKTPAECIYGRDS